MELSPLVSLRLVAGAFIKCKAAFPILSTIFTAFLLLLKIRETNTNKITSSILVVLLMLVYLAYGL